MKAIFIAFLALTLLTLLLGNPSQSQSSGMRSTISCSNNNVGISIDIDGDIDARMAEDITKVFARFHETEARIKAGTYRCGATPGDFSAYGSHFGINSRGGSIDAAIAIGRMLRQERAWLGVDGVCISACVLVLAGAVDRQIGDSASVGIHRPYFATTETAVTADQVRSQYRAMLTTIRSYLREMRVAETLADDMLAVEPERVRMLNRSELKSYGLLGLDPIEQQNRVIESEVRDIEEARRLGLSRIEYTPRKALAASVCAAAASEIGANAQFAFLRCKQTVLRTGQTMIEVRSFGTALTHPVPADDICVCLRGV